MKCIKKISLIFILGSALLISGCNAENVIETVSQVAQGVQEAAPAIGNAVNTVQGITGNGNENNNQTNPGTTSAPQSETPAGNPAQIVVSNAGDQEDIRNPSMNTNVNIQSPETANRPQAVTNPSPASSEAQQTTPGSSGDLSAETTPPELNAIRYAIQRLRERLEANDSASNIQATLTWLERKIAEANSRGVTIPSQDMSAFNSLKPRALARIAASDPRTSYTNLLNAARKNRGGVSTDCYRTSVRTANANGASGDGFTWPSSRRYRGHAIADGMRQAISNGSLKPGMVIYISRNPGTDPLSLNLSNLPHWYTYLGKDGSGVDRFADQYYTDMTIGSVAANYPNRLIDEFFDPYRR